MAQHSSWRSVLLLAASMVLPSCGGGGGGGGSVSGAPVAVTLTGVAAAPSYIDVAWAHPADPDLDHVQITWAVQGMTVGSTSGGSGAASFRVTGLAASTDYVITLIAVDAAGRASSPARFTLQTAASGVLPYSVVYSTADLDAIHGDAAGNFLLMADLDLGVAPFNTGACWTPIGDATTPFAGRFNGNQHTIANPSIIPDPGGHPVGLFGSASGAEIKDLRLVSVDLTASAPGCGGLVGYASYSSLSGCSVDGAISGIVSVGGLVGSAANSVVSGCSSAAKVVGNQSTGGIAGSAIDSNLVGCSQSGIITGITQIGGLVGYANRLQMDGCGATGQVAGSGNALGGLIGFAEASAISNCHASASVAGTGDYDGGLVGRGLNSTLLRCSATGSVGGQGYVGGLVGYGDTSTISECFATGAVTGTADGVGGFLGFSASTTAAHCYARGAVAGSNHVGGFAGMITYVTQSLYLTESYSTGPVHHHGTTADNGGFVGYDWHGHDISRCYYDQDTSGMSVTDKGDPLPTSAMKTSLALYPWDFTSVWRLDPDGVINDGYAYLIQNAP